MALRLPLGIQTFENIINGGYVYIDKTALIHQLANDGKYYFLSRPRRFGKSLLLSTLDAYFSGRSDLFRGLAMEQLESEWPTHPVLRLDLNNADYTTGTAPLIDLLANHLQKWEKQFRIERTANEVGARFKNVVEGVHAQTGKQVVVLVDEYDKPLIANVERGKTALLDEMRGMLKAFYGTLKTCDEHIRFAMLTGVSRFSHVSIFSDLNNLTDISLDRRYGELCGFTEQELHHYLDPGVAELAEENEMTPGQAYAALKRQYDGYRFSEGSSEIYNPWSVFRALSQRKLGFYWYQSGTPSFLMRLIKDRQLDLTQLDGDIIALESAMMTYEGDSNYIAPLYQTGYLTIKAYDRRTDTYTLGLPNLEVKQAFSQNLLPVCIAVALDDATRNIANWQRVE